MPALVELGLELGVEDLLEDVLEAAVIGLEDGVLGREIDRVLAAQAVVERGAGEVADRVVEVVHRHGDAGARELEHFLLDHRAVLAVELDGQLALAGHLEVGGAVLVAEGVAADDDRLRPAGTRRGTFLQMIGSRKMTPPRMLRIVPLGDFHISLRLELLHARLVGRDGGALDADAVLLDGLGGIDRDLVVGGVAVLDAEVVVVEVDVEIGVDQLVLDAAAR